MKTITLPFSTPRDIETAAQFIAALGLAGVNFEAETNGQRMLVITTT